MEQQFSSLRKFLQMNDVLSDFITLTIAVNPLGKALLVSVLCRFSGRNTVKMLCVNGSLWAWVICLIAVFCFRNWVSDEKTFPIGWMKIFTGSAFLLCSCLKPDFRLCGSFGNCRFLYPVVPVAFPFICGPGVLGVLMLSAGQRPLVCVLVNLTAALLFNFLVMQITLDCTAHTRCKVPEIAVQISASLWSFLLGMYYLLPAVIDIFIIKRI